MNESRNLSKKSVNPSYLYKSLNCIFFSVTHDTFRAWHKREIRKKERGKILSVKCVTASWRPYIPNRCFPPFCFAKNVFVSSRIWLMCDSFIKRQIEEKFRRNPPHGPDLARHSFCIACFIQQQRIIICSEQMGSLVWRVEKWTVFILGSPS